jgi:hypothetical protein
MAKNTESKKRISMELDPELDKDIIDILYKIKNKHERTWYVRCLLRKALGLPISNMGLPIPIIFEPLTPTSSDQQEAVQEKTPEVEISRDERLRQLENLIERVPEFDDERLEQLNDLIEQLLEADKGSNK